MKTEFSPLHIETLGRVLAVQLNWDGRDIFLAALAALEDSNYHQASRALIAAWESVEGPLND